MKVKFNILAEARGSVNGLTFSRNRYGAYARNRTVPIQPNSARQLAARSNMAQAVGYWHSTLTQSQRTAWRTFAMEVPYVDSLGDERFYSGQQRFVQAALLRLSLGQGLAAAATAPAIPVSGPSGPPDFGVLKHYPGNDTVVFDWVSTPPYLEEGMAYVVGIGSSMSPGVEWRAGPYRLIGGSIAAEEAEELAFPIISAPNPWPGSLLDGSRVPAYTQWITPDNQVGSRTQGIIPVTTEI